MEFTGEQLKQAVGDIRHDVVLSDFKPLSGGVSAITYQLEVAANLNFRRWVFRAHSDIHRKRNPNITHDEHMLHVFIRPTTGVPVPKPVYYGDNPDIFPIPYLITEYIEHNDQIPASPAKPFASMLTKIHQIDLTTYDYSFLQDASKIIGKHFEQVVEHPQLGVLKSAFPLIKLNPPCLLHGDYWGGNVLWLDEAIVSVIDWEDMMRGDPLADLGKSRLEFLWQFEGDMMQDYTQHYRALMPQLDYTYLPFWDLWGAWRLRDLENWFDDKSKVRRMRNQYDTFVAQAIDQCKQF